jgi:hypothetical protein
VVCFKYGIPAITKTTTIIIIIIILLLLLLLLWYEEGAVTVLWNRAVHTDREFTANRPDIIIKTKKRKRVH